MKSVIRIAGILGVVATLVAARFVYQGISKSLDAERALYAGSLTALLLDDYVAQHDNAWPRSWNDLEALPPRECGEYRWPEDSHEVKRFVEVDFSVNPSVLAEQGGDVTDTIRIIGTEMSAQELDAMRDVLRVIHENAPK